MKNIPDGAAVIPPPVRHVLRKLTAAGHEAYCVGGCVRDTLLGRTPEDWDVTTSATPEEVMEVFPRRTIPTGIRHGTVTVRSGTGGVEVTTYRIDGEYEDRRRPSSVSFVSSLEEDLRRRDFTINAIAMGLDGKLQDPCRGQEDLKAGVLRCIGDPDERFGEDALRLMRGLRFSASLGFRIPPDVEESIRRNKALLLEIAPERVQTEFCKLLRGAWVTDILRRYPEIIGVFWPEILPMIGFDQRNPHHCYDVWEHTLHAMDGVPAGDLTLRLTMLLHDIGKPQKFCLDERGVGHFPGHQALSRDMAADMLKRMRFPRILRERVALLIELHDRPLVPTEKAVRRALNQFGEETFRQLLAVKRADCLAQSDTDRGRLETVAETEKIFNALIEQQACFSLKQLAVNGDDMLALGLSGRSVGRTLNALLSGVIEGALPNEKESLLNAARKRNGIPPPGGKPSKRRRRRRRKPVKPPAPPAELSPPES
ncbi:MAG: HD domain-containing protein [Oscillibacter sp.]|nr:HD domain-containing protein [Oscillibacter sp.]